MNPRQRGGIGGFIIGIERKLFPHDSPYQRGRRRYAVVFSILGVIVLIYGVDLMINKASGRRGSRLADQPPKALPLPGVNRR